MMSRTRTKWWWRYGIVGYSWTSNSHIFLPRFVLIECDWRNLFIANYKEGFQIFISSNLDMIVRGAGRTVLMAFLLVRIWSNNVLAFNSWWCYLSRPGLRIDSWREGITLVCWDTMTTRLGSIIWPETVNDPLGRLLHQEWCYAWKYPCGLCKLWTDVHATTRQTTAFLYYM